ncbi:hypothetical protein [Planotetraspora sp. GP83]|uniref:hypothetical protein n=1 Tax=Planotetraspora sp. GP83 TaxID=3156264 RepID=UPI003511CAE9
MSKIRTILAGTAVAGALAAGLVAAPAAQAATAEASSPFKHFFGTTYSSYSGSHDEDRGDRSYFSKGYWYKDHGRYWFFGDLYDGDHDHEYSYVWFRWHDDGGTHFKSYRTFSHLHIGNFGGFSRSHGFDDFDIRVCEGGPVSDCGGWHDVF